MFSARIWGQASIVIASGWRDTVNMMRILIAPGAQTVQEEIRCALSNTVDIGLAESFPQDIGAAKETLLIVGTLAEAHRYRAANAPLLEKQPIYIIALVDPQDMMSDPASIQHWLALDLNGYLLRHNIAKELADAVHTATRGGLYLSPEFSQYLQAAICRVRNPTGL